MRIYSSESIGKILRDMREGKRPSILREAERQRAFLDRWATLPSLRLKRITPHLTFDDRRGILSIHTSSTLALTLLRRERTTIERHLRPLMEEYGLSQLVILYSDEE